MRNVLANILIGIAFMAPLTFGAENNFVGTWKLNLDQSKFNPGPGPKSLIETVEAAEGGIKVTATGQGPDGTPINSSFTAKYDGKDYAVTDTATGTPAGHHTGTSFDSIALKEVDANTLAFTTKKDGKVFSRGQAKVSGNTLTVTSKGTDAKGKSFNDTAVYDKQ
jgi:hypothetical protein